MLQYDVNHNYLQTVSYVVSSRSCTVDINDPTRVFADALEYQVDYSKVVSDINHSWKLVYNWSKGVDLNLFGQYDQVATLPNGYTYGFGGNNPTENVYNLDKVDGAKLITTVFGTIENDGSILERGFVNNQYATVSKRTLTSGNSLNLTWGNAVQLVRTPDITPNDPVYYINNNRGQGTNLSKIFFYDPNYNYNFGGATLGTGNHLGAINISNNTWNWQTSTSTGADYIGPYPTDGGLATNGGHSENCLLNIQGKYLVWHVNDELGRYTEVSRSNLFYDDGLFIAHFGNDNQYAGASGDSRYLAGNSFKTQLAKVGNDLYYFCCDESKHSGVHIVRISNLISISEQSIPLTVLAPISATNTDAADLMQGVPFKSNGFYSGNGWTANPATGDDASVTYPGWRITTTKAAYTKADNDIYIESDGNNSGSYKTVSRTLGTNNTNNWTLSGSFKVNSNLNPNYRIDLLDQNGKVLVSFHTGYSNPLSVNNTAYSAYNAELLKISYANFVIKATNGQITFSVNGLSPAVINAALDSGGDFTKPATFRIRAGGSNDNNHTLMSIKELNFTK
ncbi:MAG: hypothetical protein EOO88_08765 [Pedobacter sp.]|nr:MAG: hypothetical protein EOO88_08765 [Pedobacter sp.]